MSVSAWYHSCEEQGSERCARPPGCPGVVLRPGAVRTSRTARTPALPAVWARGGGQVSDPSAGQGYHGNEERKRTSASTERAGVLGRARHRHRRWGCGVPVDAPIAACPGLCIWRERSCLSHPSLWSLEGGLLNERRSRRARRERPLRVAPSAACTTSTRFCRQPSR